MQLLAIRRPEELNEASVLLQFELAAKTLAVERTPAIGREPCGLNSAVRIRQKSQIRQ